MKPLHSRTRSMCSAKFLAREASASRGATQGSSWWYLKVNSSETLSIFGDKCLQNSSKNDLMAPRTTLECPHEGPSVAPCQCVRKRRNADPTSRRWAAHHPGCSSFTSSPGTVLRLVPESRGQHLAVTVLCAPCWLDSGHGRAETCGRCLSLSLSDQ